MYFILGEKGKGSSDGSDTTIERDDREIFDDNSFLHQQQRYREMNNSPYGFRNIFRNRVSTNWRQDNVIQEETNYESGYNRGRRRDSLKENLAPASWRNREIDQQRPKLYLESRTLPLPDPEDE